jgi:hypothetical protein
MQSRCKAKSERDDAMGNIISTPDNKTHAILDNNDLLALIEDYMGAEVKEAIVEAVNEMEDEHLDDDECIKALNDQCGELSKNHREVMQKIYAAQLILHDLITAKELDRKAISDICGKLGGIVSTELGRPY